MGKFMEYLLEDEDKEEKNIIRISSKDELSKVSNKYLRACFTWLFSEFGKDFIKQIDYNESSTENSRGGIHGVETVIWSKSHYRTSRRKEALEKILKAFEDGPLFFQSSEQKAEIDFLWYANGDLIDKKIEEQKKTHRKYKDNSRIIENFILFCGQKMLDNLLEGSERSRYSIGYYSVNASLSDIVSAFGQGKTFALTKEDRGRKPLDAGKIKIETKVIVDFTIKSEEKANTVIKNTSDLLRLLKKPFNIQEEDSEINPGKKYFKINVLKNISPIFEENVKKALNPEKNKGSISKEESDFYSLVFSQILNDASKETLKETFDMNNLFNAEIVRNFVENETGYGVILSEILIPFCLVAGYKNIKSKDRETPRAIIKFKESKESLESVEIPISNKNVLTDYNVIFANTNGSKDGPKKYAISAKFDVGTNRTSLFTLINDRKKRNKDAFEKENEILKFIAEYVKKEDKLIQEIENCAIGYSETYQDGVFNNFLNSKSAQEKIDGIDKFTDIKNSRLKNNVIEHFTEAKPILCDWYLAKELNQKKDFLFALYNFVFDFYGKDIDFQQINLDKNFNLKYYVKEKDISEENSNKYIQLTNSSGFSEANSANPKPRVTQPLQINLLKAENDNS